ncbi:MAG: hypothetical protein JF886_00670 [Candidatus Dormibacteraeota bacterium]|uniref:Uncharacterized protein n=1 Tax=Candidatus Aeolococcus gillhamiae TaxID=3127015 RepID=A0A934K015_9BACT|nr:hypothetical protein [Candidatus Dormibacteraeota bacterium]
MAACVVTVVAACGQAAAPTVLRGEPSTYLLTIDQMVSPDFALSTSPHPLTAADVAGTISGVVQQLNAAGFLAGSGEEFFRAAGSLAEANGPLQVRDSVEEFASPAGAATVYSADVARLDAVAGARAASTGALGDAAHATTRTVTASDGTVVVELTVEWRVDNLVDRLVVRGRNGGTRLDDALLLTHRQTVTELGLATPRPSAASRAATP